MKKDFETRVINIEKKLGQHIPGRVPDTTISRNRLTSGDGFGWTIGFGNSMETKNFFVDNTLDEALTQAEKWVKNMCKNNKITH